MEDNNIILIGMPGAGKSTVGVILAKRLGFEFLDTDIIIQAREKCRLQQIIDKYGLEYFRYAEEQALLALNVERCVIATGGSVVYCPNGLNALGRNGYQIYLDVGLEELEKRIADMGQRGLVMTAEQSFADLYSERTPLYEETCELKIDCDNLNAEQVAATIEHEISQRWPELLA